MNRDDRNQQTVLDGALQQRAERIAAADEKALERLRRVGFRFTTIQQALAYQAKARMVARAQADLIREFAEWTDERKTA
ncbi:hypothetical protein [Microbacterium stercoris]|uniref:Uncharacterized protein n=1 Tax=Microbacterium stercoris TaxID=2820289 RepID=A0A939QJA6_9MICO|nr:hypothetical protein [Microbacterium stercoris]MBO3663714.1 hypothetical protein [Microbacterium stercoris]